MKKYVKSAFVAAIVAVSGYNIYQSQSVMNGMSDFALANVEALAKGEIDFPFYCAGSGYCAIDGVAYDGTKYSW